MIRLEDGNEVMYATLVDDSDPTSGELVIWDYSKDLHGFIFYTIMEEFKKLVPKVREDGTIVNKYDFTADYPPVQVSDSTDRNKKIMDGSMMPLLRPTVAYSLDRREPASQTRAPFSGSRHRKYTPVKEGYPFENNESKYLELVKQFDNRVRFSCMANTQQTAWELVSWFELFMDKTEGLIKAGGIQQLWYLASQNIDYSYEQDRIFRTDVFYYIRTLRRKYIRIDKVKEIDITVDLDGYEIDDGDRTIYTNPNEANFTSPIVDSRYQKARYIRKTDTSPF